MRFLRWLHARIAPFPFEFTVAGAVLVSSVYWLISPTYRALSNIGHTYGALDIMFTLMYVFGGILTVIGTLARQTFIELIGLVTLAGAFAASATAAVVVTSPVPLGARLVTTSILLGLVAASLVRIFTIIWKD